MRTAIFPARGGSVRIPRKNVRPFAGKPMLQWPIEAARASGLFSHMVVSTDDLEIAELARRLDCDVHMRAPDDGTTGTQEIAGRVLDWMGAVGDACVIYPCSPMLQAADLQRLVDTHAETRRTSPFLASILDTNADAGCFYLGPAEAFRRRAPLEPNAQWMRVDSARFIDINTPEDWARAESMFNALHP